MSRNTLILGLQWGDEGKGKIVDALSEDKFAVCRFQGGHNAGHTIKVNNKKTVLHITPSGILHDKVCCLVGNGVVLSLSALDEEIKNLKSAGISFSKRFFVSSRCTLILPTHIAIDLARDKREVIGTTGRGIGPAYEDKIARRAIRFGDLGNIETLKKKLRNIVSYHNQILQNIYEQEPISYNSVIEEILEYKNLYDEFCCDTQETITTWIKQDKEIIFEGAQGSLLDIDHGTYPFVTSSNTTVGGVLTGLGIGPKNIDRVVGISKAYSTRVGEGPFLTELIDKDGELLASRGNEFGATTGRPRRCGWLDLVALKKSIFMNSVTDLCITKLDVLDEFKQIKVCVSYDHLNKPVYKEFRGWQVSTEGSTSIEQLPDEARFFLDYIERFVECKISIVSTGPKRNQTINNYSF